MTREPIAIRRNLLVAAAVIVAALASLTVLVVANQRGLRLSAPGINNGASIGTISSCEPASTVGSVVEVGLYDAGAMGGSGGGMMGNYGGLGMGMLHLNATPSTVPAGKVTFIATNYGALNHEMLVMPLTPDGLGTRAIGADGKIDETGSLGEASTSCGMGPGNGISPGTRSWVTITLKAGAYEILCDQPWHYADGMYTELKVTG